MMLYTERNNMRTEIVKTYDITIDKYGVIFECCRKYLENISWKYPEYCPDGKFICGLNYESFNANLKFDIPDLFRKDYGITVPDKYDNYNQFGLLDYIEYIAQNVKDIENKGFHSYFSHYHLAFEADNPLHDCRVLEKFIHDINKIFDKTGLLYKLMDSCEVERVIQNDVLTDEIYTNIQTVIEPGVKELLLEAIQLYKSPRPQTQHLSVEKLWDAFERLKTYHMTLSKRESSTRIIETMANNNEDYIQLFTEEFRNLTTIGNDYRIRHHETNKINISNDKYFDYFFNRCLSLIALAINYLN